MEVKLLLESCMMHRPGLNQTGQISHETSCNLNERESFHDIFGQIKTQRKLQLHPHPNLKHFIPAILWFMKTADRLFCCTIVMNWSYMDQHGHFAEGLFL